MRRLRRVQRRPKAAATLTAMLAGMGNRNTIKFGIAISF